MSEQISKHDHVLLSLSMNLQTMALVQLGKVSNPATGEVLASVRTVGEGDRHVTVEVG